MMKSIRYLTPISVALALTGCGSSIYKINAETRKAPYTVPGTQAEVYAAIIRGAYISDLEVVHESNASMVAQLKKSPLTADALDKYCEYPFRYKRDEKPVTTFLDVQRALAKEKRGEQVSGSSMLQVMVSSAEDNSSLISIKTDITATGKTEPESLSATPCSSTGVMESEFIDAVRTALQK